MQLQLTPQAKVQRLTDDTYDLHAHARRTDPETSKAAARSVTNISDTHARVLAVLQEHGALTDWGIAVHYPQMFSEPVSDSGLRTRRKELVAMGSVRDSGRTKALPRTGRRAIVWEAT